MTTDDKYIVLKREEFNALMEDIQHTGNYTEIRFKISQLNDMALPDAVVIRLRDSFASAALHTYANSISVSAKAIGELAPSTRDRLLKIADYFHARGVEGEDLVTKLPD